MAFEDRSGHFPGCDPMSAVGLGRVKTPTFNLRVESPSRFRKFENQKCLRPLLREDDRENNSAHSWLVHVFTQPGSKAALTAPKSNFRFTPESGLRSDIAPCPKSCHKQTVVLKSLKGAVPSTGRSTVDRRGVPTG